MPAYNEANSIAAAIADIAVHIAAVVPDCEIVVVDDGSKDDTPRRLAEAAASEPRLRVIRQPNAGHGPALMAAADAARGTRALLLLDSDRQIDLSDFAAHWRRFEDENLTALTGIRRPRHDPRHRLILTRVLKAAIRLRFGFVPADANVPYKLIRRSAWDAIRPLIPQGAWVPSLLAAIALRARFPGRVAEVRVTHLPRSGDPSTLNARRLMRFGSHAAAELTALHRALQAEVPATPPEGQ